MHRTAHTKIKRHVSPDAIEPDAAPGIAVTIPEWNQADMSTPARPERQVGGDDVAFIADRDRAERVGFAVFTAEGEVRTIPARVRAMASEAAQEGRRDRGRRYPRPKPPPFLPP